LIISLQSKHITSRGKELDPIVTCIGSSSFVTSDTWDAFQAHRNGTPMLIASGFSAENNPDLCDGCGTCQEFCQFSAIIMLEGKADINREACFGCGVCVDKCQNKAIILNRDPQKGIPLEIEKLMNGALAAG